MRYGYATVGLPTLDPGEAIAEAAEAGYAGLEWKVGEAPHAMGSSAETFLVGNRTTLSLDPADGRRVARLSAAAGLSVIGLSPYVRTGDLSTLDKVLAVAEASGAPQIRLQGPRFEPGGPDYHELSARFHDFFTDAAEHASRSGVRLVLEIHQHTLFPSASLAQRLVSHFDPARVGVIYDVGNMVFEGYEDHRIGSALLGPYLHHVHLKNALFRPGNGGDPVRVHRPMWSPLDDGVVDVPGVLRYLDEIGYDGWVSLEDLSTERDPAETLRHNARVLAACGAPGWSVPVAG
ncbi:sugar phosphate isomerase/epimerase family protein [Amycolatopsis pithecellobii]|uniref:TIM barrel protein n=1 Tax=Amycolatopsis pithecellobii TaxID=664692 RepID=A0A6N7YW88_9PSEU|nr:sugar phosphate isomerase/epimerase family protein [Amycolatopsis pithecellobii]MTD52599.1 TIM barrel protein [Amycolatopsis pithecellobii]